MDALRDGSILQTHKRQENHVIYERTGRKLRPVLSAIRPSSQRKRIAAPVLGLAPNDMVVLSF